MLAAEKPDLVILSGDMVSGYAFRSAVRLKAADPENSWYARQWAQLKAPLSEAGVPFAAILGNHDGEADLSRWQIMELAASSPLSLARSGPNNLTGAGNYYVELRAPHASQQVAARIWFLDSMSRGCGTLERSW